MSFTPSLSKLIVAFSRSNKNQITGTNFMPHGYQYDTAGNVTNDGVNTYLYDAEGRMCAAQSKSISGGVAMVEYIYDAEGHRVAQGTITSFNCNPSANGFVASTQEVIGPGGQPVTETDGSGNWQHTNVYAGSELLATYDAQGLHFYLADPLGTRRVQLNSAGQIEGTDASLPYGDGFAQTAQDDPTTQHYAQLSFDAETGLDHAEARQYAPWMGRWTAPDPYNGSYDLANPQSLNRYAYVNNNPLGFVDPSGLAGGWATGIGGSICSNTNGNAGNSSFNGINISTPIGNINPCDPAASLVGIGISAAVNGIWGAGTLTAAQITPFVAAAVTIACSIDNFSNSACGGMAGWTSDVFTGKNAWVGKGVGDIAAVIGAALCSAGGPTSPGCVGYAIYTIGSYLFSVFWSDFGPAKFTGSLLPRPAALDGLGSSATGIPNKNLSLQDILGQPSFGLVPSPGMNLP